MNRSLKFLDLNKKSLSRNSRDSEWFRCVLVVYKSSDDVALVNVVAQFDVAEIMSVVWRRSSWQVGAGAESTPSNIVASHHNASFFFPFHSLSNKCISSFFNIFIIKNTAFKCVIHFTNIWLECIGVYIIFYCLIIYCNM